MELGGILEQSPQGKEDYYGVLGCDPSSTEEQILAEYRVKAKENHPDKEGNTEDFQAIQEAKETLLNKAKRTLYDKWRGSGIAVSFKQWESMKDSIQSGMHWATPKQERMLPEGEERKIENPVEETANDYQDNKMHPKLVRQDSSHPTIVMVNKCNQEDLRAKFRNYEI